jgi:hypothetical protein
MLSYIFRIRCHVSHVLAIQRDKACLRMRSYAARERLKTCLIFETCSMHHTGSPIRLCYQFGIAQTNDVLSDIALAAECSLEL